jgi:hypothetical protein
VQAHRDLAIGDFAECAAVLARHSHRVPPGLGKRGLVDDPDLCFTEQINYLVRQPALHFFDRPWTLAHKLAQGLHVRPFNAAGQRLNRLALPIEQQALHVNPRPVPPLAPPQRFQQVLQKVRQSSLKPMHSLWLHTVKVTTLAQELKYNLT